MVALEDAGPGRGNLGGPLNESLLRHLTKLLRNLTRLEENPYNQYME